MIVALCKMLKKVLMELLGGVDDEEEEEEDAEAEVEGSGEAGLVAEEGEALDGVGVGVCCEENDRRGR